MKTQIKKRVNKTLLTFYLLLLETYVNSSQDSQDTSSKNTDKT